jgi:hypothetical protein
MAVLPEVTAVLIYYIARDKWTDYCKVRTGYRRNSSSACSYCSTVKSQCYGNMY